MIAWDKLRFKGELVAKVRLAYFDNIKGVLIILVVVGHLLEPCARLGSAGLEGFRILDFIYMFHMPLFIFLTGLFSKSVFKNGCFRAEVPLFYFAICFLLYTGLMVEKCLLGSNVSFNYLTLNGRIPWYLMVAGFYVLGVPFFARLKPLAAMGGGLAIAVLAGLVDGTNMLSASRAITFLPLFLAGFYLSPGAIIARMKGGAFHYRWLAAVAAVITIVAAAMFFQFCGLEQLEFFLNMFYGKCSYADMLSASGLDLPLVVCMLLRLLSYAAIAVIGVALFILLPTGRVPLLTNAGARSLQIYVLHPFAYYALGSIGFTQNVFVLLPPVGAVVALMLLGTVLALLLSVFGGLQRAFDGMKARIGRWVDCQDPNARKAGSTGGACS